MASKFEFPRFPFRASPFPSTPQPFNFSITQHLKFFFSFLLEPWVKWLAIRVPDSLLEKMTPAEIVAHCVWEMTFYGFTQEKIAELRTELERSGP